MCWWSRKRTHSPNAPSPSVWPSSHPSTKSAAMVGVRVRFRVVDARLDDSNVKRRAWNVEWRMANGYRELENGKRQTTNCKQRTMNDVRRTGSGKEREANGGRRPRLPAPPARSIANRQRRSLRPPPLLFRSNFIPNPIPIRFQRPLHHITVHHGKYKVNDVNRRNLRHPIQF